MEEVVESGGVEESACRDSAVPVAPAAPPAAAAGSGVVSDGAAVLLAAEDGRTYHAWARRGERVKLGSASRFSVEPLIGAQFGSMFNLESGRLERCGRRIAPTALADAEEAEEEGEEGEIQALTKEDIQGMAQGEARVKAIVRGSRTFTQKGALARDKYVRKKQRKHMQVFRLERVTAAAVCELNLWDRKHRTMSIRPDTLAQMLFMCGVRSGARVVASDSANGLLLAGLLERMGGDGRLFHCHPGAGVPNMFCLSQMGLSESDRSPLVHMPCAALDADSPSEAVVELRKGVECLAVATSGDPVELVSRLLPILRPCGCFAVYCLWMEPLKELFVTLKQQGMGVNMRLNEGFLREMQVLPSRTHPKADALPTSGFVLSGVKVAP